MNKICVFCGKKPNDKNKEHILPQWLLKMTGDPNRVVKFGMDHSTGKIMEFDWKSLTAPACKKCNERYSDFEAEIKLLIEKISNKTEITANEAIKVLDWLDKVRIGLWLNYYYLEKNKGQINPRLCIDNRLGKKDRFMQIHFLESKQKSDGLNAFGVETMAFQFNPSCFGLRINNILIINGSNDFVISKNCGFPYPNSIEMSENGMLLLEDWKYNRKTYSIIDNLDLHKGVLTVMQPIHKEMTYQYNYFSDSYLIKNCVDLPNQIGRLFIIENKILTPVYNLEAQIAYEPVTGKYTKWIGELIAKVYEAQNAFLKRIKPKNKIFEKIIELNINQIKFYNEHHKSNAV